MAIIWRCAFCLPSQASAPIRTRELASSLHAAIAKPGKRRGISSVATNSGTLERQQSFKGLGIPEELLTCLERAFPHVQLPTASQTALIQALLPVQLRRGSLAKRHKDPSWNSVILRDVTGSGKSLALLLAMLSQQNLSVEVHKKKARQQVKLTKKLASIEQLLLVPHTELARQFESWMTRLKASSLLQDRPTGTEETDLSISQTDALNVSEPGMTPLAPKPESPGSKEEPSSDLKDRPYKGSRVFPALRQTQVLHKHSIEVLSPTTKFLITTPRYLIDILSRLSVDQLHTIALDEADAMLDLPNRFSSQRDEAKWLRHPPLLLSIMNELLASKDRKAISTSSTGMPAGRRNNPLSSTQAEKRIIAVSASANTVFRDYLARRSGWLGNDERGESSVEKGPRRQFDWYDFSSQPLSDSPPNLEQTTTSAFQQVGRSLMPRAGVEHVAVKVDANGTLSGAQHEEATAFDNSDGKTSLDPDRFLVATSALFALHEVKRGLLLIPSGQSLQATIKFLHNLAVPAVPITEVFDSGAKEDTDEPLLYVGSVDAVRGLDIPHLDWIFLPPGTRAHRDAKDYLHISGRLGRLVNSDGTRHSGTVVSLVDAGDKQQQARVDTMWKLLGIDGQSLDGRSSSLKGM